MKTEIGRLFHRYDRIERDIGAELDLHLDLLTQEFLQAETTVEEARDAAMEQFGNVEQIKAQCVEISSRNHPFVLALKCFLALVFLAGVLIRVFGGDFHITRCGNLLMMVSFLAWALLYARLNSSRFFSQPEPSSPLGLVERKPIVTYDQRRRTPVERVISR